MRSRLTARAVCAAWTSFAAGVPAATWRRMPSGRWWPGGPRPSSFRIRHMKHITFYLDFISPYAWLAFEELPQALMGLSYSVTYKPLLFAALLKHHGQLGPAEIPAKRDWTYRQVQWLAHSKGRTLDMPAAHPFNPLGLLRLALATDAQGQPNRYVCETLFRHVWVG